MIDERVPTPAACAQDGCDDARYGSYYYEHCCGLPYERSPTWLGLFAGFADHIHAEIRPKSVLDAGCAMGLLVEAFADRGVDAHGIDISSYAISKVHETHRDRCRVGSILEPFGRRFDLIVTIEVLEHLQPRDAEKAVANLCAHADDIVFSSTPFDYKEATHFNVQPPEYWAELFARHGFHRDLDYDASYITRWASRFRKTDLTPTRIVLEYERKLWRLTQENLGARESLVEHQDRLIVAKSSLAYAEGKFAYLEASTGDLDGKLGKIRASEEALSAEFHRVVEAWASHVNKLDDHIRRTTSSQQDLINRVREQDWLLADANHAASAASAERDRIVAAAKLAEETFRREHEEFQRQIREIQSSRTWRMASAVSKLKGMLGRRRVEDSKNTSALARETGIRHDGPHETSSPTTASQASRAE